MCNGNIYKKFCAIIISLGVILSVEQYSYAHSPELEAAERAAKENLTIEILERLCILYQQDVEHHEANGEYDKAKNQR